MGEDRGIAEADSEMKEKRISIARKNKRNECIRDIRLILMKALKSYDKKVS